MIYFGVVSDIENDTLIIRLNVDKYIELSEKELNFDFELREGDHLQLFYNENDDLISVKPCERETFTDQITQLMYSHGIVGSETIFYVGEQMLSIGDILECDRIQGQYTATNNVKCPYRCVAFTRIESASAAAVADVLEEFEEMYSNVKQFYSDIPSALQHMILNVESKNVSQQLDKIFPTELTPATYKKVFHTLAFLDELHVTKAFLAFGQTDVVLTPKASVIIIDHDKGQHIYTMEVDGLYERRPSLRKGDSVEAINSGKRQIFHGIIVETMLNGMEIEFDKEFTARFDPANRYTVDFVYQRGIYKKMHHAIDLVMRRMSEEFLFPTCRPIDDADDELLQLDVRLGDGNELLLGDAVIPWFKKNIDATQKAAVVHALRGEYRPSPHVIYGPPGTGKTFTLIEIILHVLTQVPDSRILIATQSNSAADLILSHLMEHDVVSVENTVRMLSFKHQNGTYIEKKLHPFCVSFDMVQSDDDVTAPTEAKVKILAKWSDLISYRIVIGTCGGLGKMVYDRHSEVPDFSHVFIDEAGQCTEPEVLMPISKVNAETGFVILAGDPMQMQSLVLCKHAKKRGLAVSLLQRLVERYTTTDDEEQVDPQPQPAAHLMSKLRFNYRSLPRLLEFYNKHFYNNELVATISDTDSPEANVLKRVQLLFPVDPKRNQKHPIFVQNVLGKNNQTMDSDSWFNAAERDMVMAFLRGLKKLRFTDEDIAIITPYHLQKKMLQTECAMHGWKIQIGGVDEIQGKDTQIVIISTVRTDCAKVKMDVSRKLGMVTCPRRTNVAISRARAVVLVVGRAKLLKRDEYWCDLIETSEANGTFFES